MGPYRYQELRPLSGYFPCHWVVPLDFFKEDSADLISNKCSLQTRLSHVSAQIKSDSISQIII